MERLPTETMVEVLGHLDEVTIHSFTIVSSKYCAIAQPLIFRRISINRREYKRFVLFVKEMEKSTKLALMIKVLIIRRIFSMDPLPCLFAAVSSLEELFIGLLITNSLLKLHYFPNLRWLQLMVSKKTLINDLVANFMPHHECLTDLEIEYYPDKPSKNSEVFHMPPLPESASGWVNRLVKYRGPPDLLPLLAQNSNLKHLISSQQPNEVALRKLSRAVSGRLLTLITRDQADWSVTRTLHAPLLPSLFPNLRSIAWFSTHITNPGASDQRADTVSATHVCLRQLTHPNYRTRML
jgi:hypothetical protein